MKRKLSIILSSLAVIAMTVPLCLKGPAKMEKVHASPELLALKQKVVMNYTAETFGTNEGVDTFKYDTTGQRELAVRLHLNTAYARDGLTLTNIGSRQGNSHVVTNTDKFLKGPAYFVPADQNFRYIDETVSALTFSYWVKGSADESLFGTEPGEQTGQREAAFSIRSWDADDNVLRSVDFCYGSVLSHEVDSENVTVPGTQQWITIGVGREAGTRTMYNGGSTGSYYNDGSTWDLHTYTMHPTNGLTMYKNGVKLANYLPTASTYTSGKPGVVRINAQGLLDISLNILKTTRANFHVHRGYYTTGAFPSASTAGIALDEFNIFKDALTDTEVELLYNSYKGVKYYDGATVLKTYSDLVGTNVPAYSPAKANYAFYRWASDAELQNPSTLTAIPSTDTNLYADWKNAANVTNGGINAATSFTDTYMHMADATFESGNYVGECDKKDGITGLSPYDEAKAAFNAMSEEGRFAFVTDAAFNDANARLQAWARANGDDFSGTTIVDASSSQLRINETNDISLILPLIAVMLLIISGYILLVRKQKVVIN